MNAKQKEEILYTKRFGYVISAIGVIISNISLINNWPITPVLFLITMYFLTGALWAPFLIKPIYQFFGKPFSLVVDSGLRGSAFWSHGECELFAAFVSNRNQCPF